VDAEFWKMRFMFKVQLDKNRYKIQGFIPMVS